MLLEGKRLLITGVLTRQSIAFSAAQVAQEQGAEILLTGFGKGLALTEMTAKRLPDPPEVLEMDATNEQDIAAVAKHLETKWGALDGFLHAIAFTPRNGLGGEFLNTPWDSVALSFRTSVFSLKALAVAVLPLMQDRGGSIVSLDFDASVAWPVYDWMGVSKAGMEAVNRYLAGYLGRHSIRVNSIAAGPLSTTAAKGIPGFDGLVSGWSDRAPLGWDPSNPAPVARTIAFLLSDWSQGITGEIIHVDGGYHAMGAEKLEGI